MVPTMRAPPYRAGLLLRGFTLVELLVVLAIVSLLAAILFPVFAQAREKARQTVCLASEKQLGLAFFQYASDYDDALPNGINDNAGERYWPGEGWAGQCAPYVKSLALLQCPTDLTPGTPPINAVVSYGYNINLVGPVTVNYYGPWVTLSGPSPSGLALAALSAPDKTVMLFEVSGVTAHADDAREGELPGGTPGTGHSPSANGLDNRLYALDASTSTANQYATGYLGGRLPPDPASTQFSYATGRHGGGSNFLLSDGHARWLPGASVSSGVSAQAEACRQDNLPPLAGCVPALPGALPAAGTGALDGNPLVVTFSAR